MISSSLKSSRTSSFLFCIAIQERHSLADLSVSFNLFNIRINFEGVIVKRCSLACVIPMSM